MTLHAIEISRSALLANVETFREVVPESRFMAVIKSNAYGHGMLEVAGLLAPHVDWFGVNTLAEARRIRAIVPEPPILVMGLNGWEDQPVPQGVTLVLASLQQIQAFGTRGIPFHIKIDTGLSRLGLRGSELDEALQYLAEHPQAPWTGVMTHFANVEDVTRQDYALEQIRRFQEAREQALAVAGSRSLLFHAAASAAALILPESRLDMIRVGISLYGLWPSNETRLSLLGRQGPLPILRAALSWRSQIVQIHSVPAGASVGYGCTARLERDSLLAVIPIGYFEGYDRLLSSRAHVLVRGRRAPVIGRVSMNMISVDVTHIPDACAGDRATLIGRDGAEIVSAEDLAAWAGTINYEIVSRIIGDLPRTLVT